MLNIKQTLEQASATVALEGRLDTTTAPERERALSWLPRETAELTLDFAELEYISSAGLRVLLAAQKRMHACNGDMKVTHVGPCIMEIFEVTGFSDVLNIQ